MLFLMSASIVLCEQLVFFNRSSYRNSPYPHNSSSLVVQLNGARQKFCGLVRNSKKIHSGKRRSWWKEFFLDDENWFGLKDEYMLEGDESESLNDEELTEGEKFEVWKKRAESIIELRESQEEMRNEENRKWTDWLIDGNNDVNSWSDELEKSVEEVREDPNDMIPGSGLVKSVGDLVLGREDDEMLYEDRVFSYASFNSAKFLAVLIIVPWALDFLVHDYAFMPFLDRYVKTVPLAARMLDVRRHQKLEMVNELNIQKARFRLEVEIGISPPLSDEELWLELRHKALELQDERRLENRRVFANIWSDMVFGFSLFILLYFNQSKVALLKFTGYKIINNISGTGKAFLIILVTDIFLGYHSELGWQTLLEIIIEHYGLAVDQAAITIFVCVIPVILDACVKLWMDESCVWLALKFLVIPLDQWGKRKETVSKKVFLGRGGREC